MKIWKQPTRNNPCRLSYYLLDFNFLPCVNDVRILETIVLDKLRNSGLVALCDAWERVPTLHSVSHNTFLTELAEGFADTSQSAKCQWEKISLHISRKRRCSHRQRQGRKCNKAVCHRQKNWLFSNTAKGAKASAALYSLISTAQANGLDAEKYLTELFSKPAGTILLPWDE